MLIAQRGGSSVKSKVLELGVDNLSLEGKSNQKEPIISIKPPPPPPAPLSPVASNQRSPTSSPPNLRLEGISKEKTSNAAKQHTDEQHYPQGKSREDILDDDFGDFQAAGKRHIRVLFL